MGKTSSLVSKHNAQFLKQEGVTVKGHNVVSASNGNVQLSNGERLSVRGLRAEYDSERVRSYSCTSGGDTAGDDL